MQGRVMPGQTDSAPPPGLHVGMFGCDDTNRDAAGDFTMAALAIGEIVALLDPPPP